MRTQCIVLFLALIMGVSACGAAPTSEGALESPLASPITAVTVTAERARVAERATPTALPSPQPDKGTVVGQFVEHNSGEPVAERVIYLGELSPLKTQDGGTDSHYVMMVPSTSPSATTDPDGYFAFIDVEPSTYAIVLWTPVNSWVLTDQETQEDVLVPISAGETIDLGTISIRTSP